MGELLDNMQAASGNNLLSDHVSDSGHAWSKFGSFDAYTDGDPADGAVFSAGLVENGQISWYKSTFSHATAEIDFEHARKGDGTYSPPGFTGFSTHGAGTGPADFTGYVVMQSSTTVDLYRFVAGAFTSLGSWTAFPATIAGTARLVGGALRFTLSFDGVDQTPIDDPSPLPAGWAGYRATNGNYFRTPLTSKIRVTDYAAAVPELSPPAATIDQGGTVQLTLTGGTATGYTSSDPTIATVSPTGLVTGQAKAGSVTIIPEGLAGTPPTAAITVRAVSVTVDPPSASVAAGGTVQFSATVLGTTNAAVTWSKVSGGGSVSAGGLYTAPGGTGVATVRATAAADATAHADATVTTTDDEQLPIDFPFGPTYADLSTVEYAAYVNGVGGLSLIRDYSGAGVTQVASGTGVYRAVLSAPAGAVVIVLSRTAPTGGATGSETFTMPGAPVGTLDLSAGSLAAIVAALGDASAAVWAELIDGDTTAAAAVALVLAATTGATAGVGTSTLRFKSPDGTADRIIATVDNATGGRSAVTLNPPG